MLLSQSFNAFVISNAARPYMASKIEGFSNSATDAQDMFGLGGIYNSDSDELHVTVGQVVGGVDFKNIISCVLGVYRVIDGGSDYLIQDTQLTTDLLKKSKTSMYYWELMLKTQVPSDELMLGCMITTSSGSYSTWIAVEVESQTKMVRYYRERFRTSQDVLLEHQPQTRIVVEATGAGSRHLELDFSVPENPIVYGDGVLDYNGGGNRYLINIDGLAEEQVQDQTPWSVPASVFVESGATNYLSDSGLHLGTWKTHTSSSTIINEQFVAIPSYPSTRGIAYSVSSPSVIDSTWEWESEIAVVPTTTLTGSLFWECTPKSGRVFSMLLGLRIYNAAGTTILKEVTTEITPDQASVFGLRYVSDFVTTPSSTTRRASLFVRVGNLCPGDRFECLIGIPQIESTATATSRIKNLQTRVPDNVTWLSADSAYDDSFGRFELNFYAAYDGAPGGLGDQYFFDTRDSLGEAGWYCKHRWDGVIEFGLRGETSTESWVLESASVIQLIYGQVFKLTCWFDTNILRVDLNSTKIGEQLFQTNLNIPDLPRVRLGRAYTDSSYMNGELLSFYITSDSINTD